MKHTTTLIEVHGTVYTQTKVESPKIKMIIQKAPTLEIGDTIPEDTLVRLDKLGDELNSRDNSK